MTSSRTKLKFASLWLAAALGFASTVAVVAGCSHKPTLTPEQQADADLAAYEAQIRSAVPDPARAGQLMALTREFQQLAQGSVARAKQYRADVTALNSNYAATRAQYQALFSEQDANREAFQKKAGALRDRMAALTTDAEWEKLNKARLTAVEAYMHELRD